MSKKQAKTKAIASKTRPVAFKVTPEQYALISERAEQRGVKLGYWIRSIVMQAANSPKNGRHIRIYEPNGTTS